MKGRLLAFEGRQSSAGERINVLTAVVYQRRNADGSGFKYVNDDGL
jgi:hypothetical protein